MLERNVYERHESMLSVARPHITFCKDRENKVIVKEKTHDLEQIPGLSLTFYDVIKDNSVNIQPSKICSCHKNRLILHSILRLWRNW